MNKHIKDKEQYLVKILLYRKRSRCEEVHEIKINGPMGIGANVSSSGGIYFKGKCVYANLEDSVINLDMSNDYLLNKLVSVKIHDAINHLHPLLKHPYWTPQPLANGDYKIYSPPRYCLLSIKKDKATPNYPRLKTSSELIITIHPYATDVFKVEHLYTLPPWINHIVNNEVDKLTSLYYNYGSIPII